MAQEKEVRMEVVTGFKKLFVYLGSTKFCCFKKRFVATDISIAEVIDKMAILDQPYGNFAVSRVEIRAIFMVIEVCYMEYAHKKNPGSIRFIFCNYSAILPGSRPLFEK